eukprot:Clim_evm14s251 gene=Clim_evmTU14s251
MPGAASLLENFLSVYAGLASILPDQTDLEEYFQDLSSYIDRLGQGQWLPSLEDMSSRTLSALVSLSTVSLTILGCGVAFLAGTVTTVAVLSIWVKPHAIFRSRSGRYEQQLAEQQSAGINSLVQHAENRRVLNIDKRMTGARAIDKELQLIFDNVIHDHVESWYTYISEDPEFLIDLRKSLFSVVAQLVGKAKNMDAVSFVMLDAVDDFARHLRLWSLASNRHAAIRTQTPDLDISISQIAFEIDKGRFSFIVDRSSEASYLRDLLEVILYTVMPSDDFNNLTSRFMLLEVLVLVIQTALDKICDPDFINQTVCTLVANQTWESFLENIRKCDSLEELEIHMDRVTSELKQRMSSSSRKRDAANRLQIRRLEVARRLVVRRINAVKAQNLSDDTEVPSTYADAPPALVEILHDPVAIGFFMDFMESEREIVSMQFWLVIEAFRRAGMANQIQKDTVHYEMVSEARAIFDLYVSLNANPRIPLEASSAKNIAKKINDNQVQPRIFDYAQTKVYEFMDAHCYPRFVKSEAYLRYVYETELRKDDLYGGDIEGKTEAELDTSGVDSERTPSTSKRTNWQPPSRQSSRLDERSNAGSEHLADSYVDESDRSSVDAEMQFPLRKATAERTPDALYASNISSATSLSQPAPSTTSSMSGSYAQPRSAPRAKTPSINSELKSSLMDSEGAWTTKIVGYEISREKNSGKAYAVFIIEVFRQDEAGVMQWRVLRRYSEFHDLHMQLRRRLPGIDDYIFPGKKTFGNLSETFLEQRRYKLDKYLNNLLLDEEIFTNVKTRAILSRFLSSGAYNAGFNKLERALDTVINPLSHTTRIISDGFKAMTEGSTSSLTRTYRSTSASSSASGQNRSLLSPATGLRHETFASAQGKSKSSGSSAPSVEDTKPVNTVPPMPSRHMSHRRTHSNTSRKSDSSAYSGTSAMNTSQVKSLVARYVMSDGGADYESFLQWKLTSSKKDMRNDEVLPFRIILLLMDEIFELTGRNRWLRRRTVQLLQQVISTTHGVTLNRKTVAMVEDALSPEQWAYYFFLLRTSIWPDSARRDSWDMHGSSLHQQQAPPERTEQQKRSTKLDAKARVLAMIPHELKSIIGGGTAKRGVLRMFDMLQDPLMNRRLVLGIFEAMLIRMLPEINIVDIVNRTHRYHSKHYQQQRNFS